MANIKPKAKMEGRICVLFKENLLSSLLLAILPGTMDTAVHTTGKIKGSLKGDLLSSRRNFPAAVITQLPEAVPSLHPSMIEIQQLLPPKWDQTCAINTWAPKFSSGVSALPSIKMQSLAITYRLRIPRSPKQYNRIFVMSGNLEAYTASSTPEKTPSHTPTGLTLKLRTQKLDKAVCTEKPYHMLWLTNSPRKKGLGIRTLA